MDQYPNQVTELLVHWREGDRAALDALIPLVYSELRRIARRHLRQESPTHTLQGTALVHEAYVRLLGQEPPQLQNRVHFFAVAAQIMRQILVDHARARKAAKRGGGGEKVVFEDHLAFSPQFDVDLIALDDAMKRLAELDEQQSRIVELRFFAGLSIEDTSAALGVSPRTVKRGWLSARSWLYKTLSGAPS